MYFNRIDVSAPKRGNGFQDCLPPVDDRLGSFDVSALANHTHQPWSFTLQSSFG